MSTELPDESRREASRLAGMVGGTAGPAAVAAATVILLRDAPTPGPPEVLMVRRNSRLAFAGGLWVFPGGRVDPGDFASGEPSEDPDALAEAEARAAAREAFEEAGLVLDASTLCRWSHWTPPMAEVKRFSTAFFVAAAPAGTVVIDDGEIHDHRWVSAGVALGLAADGVIELLPPTFVTLHQLASFTSTADALEAAPGRAVEHFTTRIHRCGDEIAALFFGDAHYALDSADQPPSPQESLHRLWISTLPWRYERTVVDTPWQR